MADFVDRLVGNIEARLVRAPFWAVAAAAFIGCVAGVALVLRVVG